MASSFRAKARTVFRAKNILLNCHPVLAAADLDGLVEAVVEECAVEDPLGEDGGHRLEDVLEDVGRVEPVDVAVVQRRSALGFNFNMIFIVQGDVSVITSDTIFC